MDATDWNERYGSATALWSGEPNPQLSVEVRHLAPGRALEAGCGEGADAIFLAEMGWRVTAVDFSSVALERAGAHAARRGDEVADRITWSEQDLLAWPPPQRAFELVSCAFVHLPAEERVALHRRLASAVAPGGTLLLVGHHPLDLELDIRRPDRANLFDGDEVLDALGVPHARDPTAAADPGHANPGPTDRDNSGWTVVTNEARSRPKTDAAGDPVTLHDTVVTLRRASP